MRLLTGAMHAETRGKYDETINHKTNPLSPGCTVKFVTDIIGAESAWFNMNREVFISGSASSSVPNPWRNSSDNNGRSFSEYLRSVEGSRVLL